MADSSGFLFTGWLFMHLVNKQELVEVKNARRAAAGEKSLLLATSPTDLHYQQDLLWGKIHIPLILAGPKKTSWDLAL